MTTQKNHQTLVTQVNMYLDNELSPQAERELLRSIQENPVYMEILSKEKSFRDFIKSRVRRRKVSPALIQSIKDKISL